MRSKTLVAAWISIIAGIGIGQEATPPSEVLVAMKGTNNAEAVARIAAPFGKVLGKNKNGFFRIALRPSLSSRDVARKLAKSASVRYAFPGSAAISDASSIGSLDDFIAYQLAVKQLAGIKGDDAQEVDYFDSLRDYLSARVGPNGRFDSEAMLKAAEHRDAMPGAPRPAAGVDAIGVEAVAGSWSYVGPKNLAIPYQVYYGQGPLSGRVNAIAVDPTNTNIIYIASAGGGVHKSINGGTTWEAKSDNWPVLGVSSLALDPTNPQVIYAGTGDFPGNIPYANGIMKSTNGGATWAKMGDVGLGAVSDIVVDPESPQIVIATTGRGGVSYKGKVWRSTNGGVSFSVCKDAAGVALPDALWSDLDVSPLGQGARRYWAAGGASQGSHLWRSTDKGATWVKVPGPSSPFESRLAVATSKRPIAQDTLYYVSPFNDAIYRADDAGSAPTPTWIDITSNFPKGDEVSLSYNWSQIGYDLYLATSVSSNDPATQVDLLYAGLITLAVNVGGVADAWTDIGETYFGTAKSHNDQHCYTPMPGNPTVGFQGCDGGIFRTELTTVGTPAVATFTSLNSALFTTQFYAMTLHPTSQSWVMGGTQDNASPASRGDLANWGNPGQGDGMYADIQDNNPLIQYHGWQRARVKRTVDGFARTNTTITPNYGGDWVGFIHPMTLGVGTQAGNLYLGTNYVWRFNGSTLAWEPRIGGTKVGGAGYVRALGVSPSDADRFYTGSTKGDVYMTSNLSAASPVWTSIDSGGSPSLPDEWVSAIAVRPFNPTDIVVGLSTMKPGNLWRCSNTAAATRVWQFVSGSGATALPSVPVNSIAFDPYNSNMWYVANDVGVFVTYDSGGNWYNATNVWGLPNARVNDLKIFNYGGSTYLYAATYGRGIWRIPLASMKVASLVVPAQVTGGFSALGQVNVAARSGGESVSVTSSNTALILSPGAVKVPVGQTSASFTFYTRPTAVDTNVTLTATLGTSSKAGTVLVKRPELDQLVTPTSVIGGAPITGRVMLNTSAPAGGVAVSVTDNSAAIWGYTSPVVVPAGVPQVNYTLKSNPVTAATLVTCTASLNGIVRTSTVNVLPGGFSTMFFTLNTIVGGNSAFLRVGLSGPAPTGGIRVTLSPSTTGLTLPSYVTVPAGSSSYLLLVPTQIVSVAKTVTVTGTWGNTVRTAQITLATP